METPIRLFLTEGPTMNLTSYSFPPMNQQDSSERDSGALTKMSADAYSKTKPGSADRFISSEAADMLKGFALDVTYADSTQVVFAVL